ncbi:hypothetical protein K503DRAFT_683170, partial [Rhizopogon vinicolor AM-OR11-026]
MTLILQQNVYIEPHGPIVVDDVHESTVVLPVLRRLLDSAQGGAVGMAAMYRPDCSLSSLAFATLTRALVVQFSAPQKPKQRKKKAQEQRPTDTRARILLRDHILCDPSIQLYGYRMDRIVIALFVELSLRINAAVDILSVSPDRFDRRSLQAIMNALGGELLLQKEHVKSLFEDDVLATKDVAIQAWAACRAATRADMASRYATLSRIATDTMPDDYLSVLAKISRQGNLLESLKPTKVVNNVKGDLVSKKGNLNIESTRFSTRIVPPYSSNQVIRIETQVGDQRSTITGRAHVKGRQAYINVKGVVHPTGKIISVTTVGKGSLTAAESCREDVVRQALQGTIKLTQYPFFCSIWMPSFGISWPPSAQNGSTKQLIFYPSSTLNSSQDIAVQRIVSEQDRDRLVLIQGPPGTGKTTVIAASVMSII